MEEWPNCERPSNMLIPKHKTGVLLIRGGGEESFLPGGMDFGENCCLAHMTAKINLAPLKMLGENKVKSFGKLLQKSEKKCCKSVAISPRQAVPWTRRAMIDLSNKSPKNFRVRAKKLSIKLRRLSAGTLTEILHKNDTCSQAPSLSFLRASSNTKTLRVGS